VKSKSAFLLSAMRLAKNREHLYLWTLTFSDVVDYKTAMARLRSFTKQASRRLGLSGLRVVEVHPGGHGLHFHLLCRVFVPVQIMRRLTARAGFGRIHVCRIEAKKASYTTKHFAKQKRLGWLKGKRLWGSFGFDHCRVRDILTNSRQLEIYRRLTSGVVASATTRLLAWHQAGRMILEEIRAGCCLFGSTATNLVYL